MLKSISPLISLQLLIIHTRMGYGDEIVLVRQKIYSIAVLSAERPRVVSAVESQDGVDELLFPHRYVREKEKKRTQQKYDDQNHQSLFHTRAPLFPATI